MEKITVVIVTHQSEKDIRPCLISLKKAAEKIPVEVIAVDSGSSDSTVSILEKEFSWVKLIKLRNIGFAAAANAGAAKAQGDIIFFLNPDTLTNEDIFEKLLANFSNEKINILGCNLVDAEENPEVYHLSPFPNLWVLFLNHLLGVKKNIPESLSKCDWVSGGALVTRKKFFENIGGFSEKFFLYFEDVDFCRRAKKLGEDIWFDPNTKIVHFKGGSSDKEFRTPIYDRSQLQYFSENRSVLETFTLVVFRFFLREWKKIIIAFFAIIFATAAIVLLGILKALLLAGLVVVFCLIFSFPVLGIAILCLSLLFGQTVRIPFLTSFVNLSDICLAIVIISLFVGIILKGYAHHLLRNVSKGWWMILALAPGIMFASVRVPMSDFLVLISYTVRLLAVLFLVPLIQTLRINYSVIKSGLLVVGLLIAILGFVQLVFVPNLPPAEGNIVSKALLSLSQGGWDPHNFRLFSTWLDPNFLAEFFVMMTVLALIALGNKIKMVYVLGILIFPGALVLTQSRSGLVALVCSLIIYLFFGKARRLLIPLASVSVVALILFPSLFTRLLTSPSNDPTAQLRMNSVSQAIDHFENYPVWGIGYNAYGIEQTFSGNVNQKINSKSGTDNSLALLAATLGIWGLVILSFGFSGVLGGVLKLSKLNNENALVFLLALASLLIHSQFVQSLTYIHLMIPAILLFSTIKLEKCK